MTKFRYFLYKTLYTSIAGKFFKDFFCKNTFPNDDKKDGLNNTHPTSQKLLQYVLQYKSYSTTDD